MNYLLDTCALLALADGRLSSSAHDALTEAHQAVISPVVQWELAIKVKAGKLTLPEPPLAWVASLALRHHLSIPAGGLDAPLLCAAADLPLIHRDPFDRVIIATALWKKLTILTSDAIIPIYPGVRTLW